MIDRNRRDYYARLLRRILLGRLTYSEFGELTTRYDRRNKDWHYKTKDAGCFMAMNAINDLFLFRISTTDTIELSELNEEGLLMGNRMILFLKTDFEFQWEEKHADCNFLLTVFSFIFTSKKYLKRKEHAYNTQGDIDVWPFLKKEDYEVALVNYRYYIQDCSFYCLKGTEGNGI